MSSIQFISCNAKSCIDDPPYGHDVYFRDIYKHYLSSNNPFHKSYTTNINENRILYNGNGNQHIEKRSWLIDGMIERFVGITGSNWNKWCGTNEANPCKTVGFVVENCLLGISSTIIVTCGNHESESTTINVREKNIRIEGKGKNECAIGTGALSSSSSEAGALLSVTTGYLSLLHMKVDCNSIAETSPNVVVVSDGGGSISLEDVVITTSVSSGNYVMSSSVFVVALSQLSMVGVEIINMNVSEPLFSEPDQSSSSSSSLSSLSSSSSSALYLTATASGDSVLANVKVMNVKLTEGDGVVVAKSVKAGETFVVWNTTMEGCECANGNGGGIKVELEGISSEMIIGASASYSGGSTKFNKTKCSGYGGGVMLWLADNSFDFTISSVSFVDCSASLGGKDVFVNGSRLVSGTITITKLNFEYNVSIYDELMGYDRNEAGMEVFPLNIFLAEFSGAAHAGKKKNGLGGYDSWFCGFDYYPCATITYAAFTRYASTKKEISLDPEFELAEVVVINGEEWKISCIEKGTKVYVKAPSIIPSMCVIYVQSICKLENISFYIPSMLSSVSSLIELSDTFLTITDCSVTHSSESTSSVDFGYSIVNAQSGSLKMEKFLIEEGMTFNEHSAIEFCEGMTNVICSGCNISGDVKNDGDGGWMKGTVGGTGTLTVDGCNVNGCSCAGGKGGGIYVELKGNGKVVVNGTSVIDGCKAENIGGRGGRGGGMFVLMESGGCGLTIGQNVKFSKVKENMAEYGKDVFVDCGSGAFLESKVNTSSFAFFDVSVIPLDVLKLSGSENGDESEVIPLFVYLCTMGTKVIVDGSGGNGMDHKHCGFEGFGCLTVDYCANSRMSESSKEIEIVSSSSINDEIEFSLFDAIISGRISSSDEGEMMRVNVSDGGSDTQDWLVGCTGSLTMSRLSFVVKGPLNSRRSAFIHSTSTLSMTNCSVSFESGALTDGKIGYSIIDMAGGNLVVDGFVMEGPVRMNGKSPIAITNGVRLEIMNSRVSGVEVNVAGGSGGGGCLNVGMGVNGNVKIEESNLSSTCSGGNGMKGGGIMISIGSGGSFEMKNVNLSECEVPSEDREDGGKGMGGGIFAELPNQMGSFVMEGMAFEGCNAWKGKNVFASGWDLREIVSEEHLKWEMSSEELGSLDELCGWERKTTGENGYVIPLVVYLWRNWSGDGFVSREKGGDFSGCGYSEAPCSSIDHLKALRYELLGEGETHIKITGSGLLKHSITFASVLPSEITVSIEGEEKDTILKVSESQNGGPDEGDGGRIEGAFIESYVRLSIINVSFFLPKELGVHSSLVESSESSGWLSIADCSMVCEDLTKEVKYCIIEVNKGGVMIDVFRIRECVLLKGFFVFTVDVEEITMTNVSISNTTVSGRSLISLSEELQGSKEMKKEMRNAKQTIRLNSSSFTNIGCEDNRAGVVDVDLFLADMKFTVEGCVMTKCMSERSEEGGGMKVCLKSGESELKVDECSFGMCVCSVASGRGGGLMIDGVDPNVENIETKIPALGLKMERVRFLMNDAYEGKDAFITCYSIEDQINEKLFVLDFGQDALKSKNSICGRDEIERINVDLIPLITFYRSAQVFVSSSGSDGRQCGAQNSSCKSINCAIQHIEKNLINVLWIDEEGVVEDECLIGDLNVKSLERLSGIVRFERRIETGMELSVMMFMNECSVERCWFAFGKMLEGEQEWIMKEKNGVLAISECLFSALLQEMMIKCTVVSVESGELKISDTTFKDIHLTTKLISFCEESKVVMIGVRMLEIVCEGKVIEIGGKSNVEMKDLMGENITVVGEGSVIVMEDADRQTSALNCSFGKCVNSVDKGSMMQIRKCKDVKVEACMFDGEKEEETMNEGFERKEELCKWSGSLIDFENSNVEMKETTIKKSKAGGLWVSGGSVKIENSKFENNNPSIEGYPSVRRNAICEGNGELDVVSVKGGDGMLPNTSLWILDEGCQLGGIASERGSSFFIPVLEEVKNTTQQNGDTELIIHGKLLLPCNLSVKMSVKNGDEEEIEKHMIDEKGRVSENEIRTFISSINMEKIRDMSEVSVCILFGNSDLPSSTDPFILKNKSEHKSNGDDKLVEGGKGSNSFWVIIAIACSVVIVLLVIIVALVVRWRKQKRRTEELEVIVNDTVRKDPKVFEMMMIEPSPEAQWRRAEREAEKKNEERIKKRVYENSLGHSESSEHLLSENGSTEYILGRDSDKIPQWMLENADEKEDEEARKRTPSPSISSTSTTDSDSTFVRGEDLCPTTSSMSNLVDAMACSSPHEKLIVDLRNSLFMLLHGRNEKKEMAIGNLQERELTGAQILFWVANGALHSLDEMEDQLQSLSNLYPHVVLFGEGMVICIALHSDYTSSSVDSDSSSSLSTSTIVTSSSDCSHMDDYEKRASPPLSAFEDENEFKKECLRWKAPELQISKKMEATKQSVAFSIGMMLWECLTLCIPLDEYDAETAGQKIANGERPSLSWISESSLSGVVKKCLEQDESLRPTIVGIKRELMEPFGGGAVMFTMSDAVYVCCKQNGNESKPDRRGFIEEDTET
ncbi:uncharacterized protein MONOS_2050 [Monocercomonoides exilis]|uniref:uncharacterized protein n=1 Tax=Monocercomonoides exilis TaxID=2049356 RepID=UPI00355AB3DB|nr:hypothetical protein MONOS_2050 [Monocercomonoides exilis]|eukprot:MONOS_2050.1-p1 / transcript=MONOS_2050.1 / gene=MONOS_2050 / organism=Monocercomonoides_exilis_PA203 / gene_product=unspecified product / transcript_product=unspecified product / location=Mono_scaffold00040:34551-42251(-) / protein_length=2536 / sequence_SO=supercontig / SO=protein_coding / is_pseudo=false